MAIITDEQAIKLTAEEDKPNVTDGRHLMAPSIPPVSPESSNEATVHIDVERWQELTELIGRVKETAEKLGIPLSGSQLQPAERVARPSALSLWIPSAITGILQGFTLIGIVALAFWFGGMSKTVDNTAEDVKTLRSAVLGNSKDSLSSRMSVVETRLDNVDKKLDNVDKKLDNVDKRLDNVDKRLDNVDKRLDSIDKTLDSIDNKLDQLAKKP